MKVNWFDGFVYHHVESFELNLCKGHPMVVFKFIPGSNEFDLHTNGMFIEYIESLDVGFSIGDDDD